MASARGQNVSVLHLLGPESLDPPAAGSGRAPGSGSGINKSGSMNGKSLSQHSLAGAGRSPLADAYGGALNSSSSSSSSVNRELSPVRWCDREVDGVYLGRSGWVQVQQRSLDDGKGTGRGPSNPVSSLHSSKYLPDFTTNSLERREQNRPINLPLPSKRRADPRTHYAVSTFVQEYESLPSPSITPILSPPPAFRDEGTGVELPRQPPHPQDSLHKSRFAGNREGSPTLASPVPVGSRSGVSPMSQKHYQFSQTKSLDENSLERRTRKDGQFSAGPLTFFGFHSFDNDFRKTRGSEGGLAGMEEKATCYKCEEEEGDENGNEENGFGKRYTGQRTPSCERDPGKSSRQRKYQLNGKRTFVNDSNCGYKPRSPSSDSNSSSSSSGSDGRRPQNSRRFGKGQENFTGGKHFNVKRSRSLQLSEERPPRELTLMSHSSSGRSWDRVSPESPTFQAPTEPDHFQSLRNLHKVIVTVNGQSIPVLSSDDQFLNLLNEITNSEEEQKQLIREAEREARVISDFLIGTRSRAAARNLLIHRYLRRSKPPGLDLNEGGIPSKPEATFPRSARRIQSKPGPWIGGSLPPEAQSRREERTHPETGFPKGYSRPYATPSPVENLPPSKDHPGRQKDAPRLVPDPRSKRTHQGPLPGSISTPGQRLRPKTVKTRSVEKLERSHRFAGDSKMGTHGRHVRGDAFGGDSSSSSEDLRENAIVIGGPISSASDLSLDCICLEPFPADEPSKAFRCDFNPRSVSGPETDECASAGLDQRSLSLPRSFPSDQYRPNYFSRRNSFPWRQDRVTTPSGHVAEWAERTPASRTVPTTPVRDSRDDRTAKPPNRVKRNRLSRIALLNDSTFPRTQWPGQKLLEKVGQKNGSAFEKRSSKVSDRSPETARQSFQDFPLRYSGTGVDPHGESENDETDPHDLALSDRKFSGFGVLHSEDEVLTQSLKQPPSGLKKDRRLRNGAFAYDKYDSYDSGIQIGIRGNIDSSESQDTDLQEDADNLFMGSLHRGVKISGEMNRKGVRRTKSDLGGLRLKNLDVKNRQQKIISNTSSLRGSETTNLWKPFSPEDSAVLYRSLKPPLRRSLSLNELLPFERQKPSRVKPFTFSEDEKNLFGGTSDDDLLSDSESSVASLSERKKPSKQKEEPVRFAEAVWDHVAMEPFELPFRAGDVIEVLDTRDRNWWWGATEEHCGYFPSAFVRLRVSQENSVEDCFVTSAPAPFEASTAKTRRGKTCSLLSGEQVRSSVVRELLNTEREFVKILRDVKDGYIAQCSRRPDMFTSAQIATIFSNLEDILLFQEQFLKDLERRIDQEFPHKSCVGEAFLNHCSGFRMYSEYCNSHPMAMATLQELCQKNSYSKFFEMCRLKQNLTEIPLDGYLLTPVQRICKYPLQLAELLKYTKPDHPDFGKVEKALETMRSVATLINERKRKMESLEKLAAWQQRVEGWEGEDLIELSSRLIHQGDVVRITSGMWTTNITLFLFDHQIIYCKRDLLKRNQHIYKGRICLDASEVVDLPDGKNQQLGVTVKYGIKICSGSKEKWLVFCCRSGEEKMKWLEALAEERRLVAQDKEGGLELPPTAKHLADMAARTKKIISNKARGKNKMASSYEEISQLRHNLLNAPKVKGGRRMGTWLTTFGGVMKSPKANLRHRASLQQMT